MRYRIEVYDTWGRRIAVFGEVPLLEAVRTTPDQADVVRGLLPSGVADLSHAYRVRVLVEDRVFCEATVARVAPQWSDTRKLILDRYVHFHEVIELEAERAARMGNTEVARAYTNEAIGAIVKDAINRAGGAVHYTVAHGAYPDGAVREYEKFLQRKTAENELEVGGIETGQWVGSDRMDLSGAYAKDGDTIAGVKVDGEAWPDIRLMLIDSEELTRNSHAIKRHPEVAGWSNAAYAASGYAVWAEAARDALQDLLDTKGIDYIELNPHRNALGAFDDRVDAYGRYVGLVYGGGQCLNAAMVELGHADVYLYEDGKYHVPELALKEFYSYTGVCEDSVEDAAETLVDFDVKGGVFEVLTALAYAAGGCIWSVGPDLAVRFRRADRPDRVAYFDPVTVGVTLGSDSGEVANAVYFEGNPFTTTLAKTYTRGESIDEYGFRAAHLDYYSVSLEEDADKLAAGLLDDLAYPEPSGSVVFLHGEAEIQAGDLVELRGGALRRLERELAEEWGGRFAGRLVGRVRRVKHRFSGRQVTTTVDLMSPLRSVENPLGFMVRSQPGAKTLFQFRLDEATVGLDMGYHLD